MDTRAKAQNAIDAVGFNSLAELSFPSVVLSGTTQNNGVVAARLWVPTTVKIYRVIAGIFGSVAGTVSLNVVADEAAEVPNTDATQFLSMPIPEERARAIQSSRKTSAAAWSVWSQICRRSSFM